LTQEKLAVCHTLVHESLNPTFVMKIFLPVFCCLFCQIGFAHGFSQDRVPLKHWNIAKENQTIEASFLMFKNGNVFLEDPAHKIAQYPIAAFSTQDQAIVRENVAKLEQLNNPNSIQQLVKQGVGLPTAIGESWFLGFFMVIVSLAFYWLIAKRQQKHLLVAISLLLVSALYSFKTDIQQALVVTDPAFVDAAFEPFKPKVHTFWDDTYFYVESKGIPSHQMMTGITGWQQQVPIPQCYIGNNAWPIPLNPMIAATPVPVSPQHFLRGAIAIAANGVPIFNPFTNTGVDALLDGQLDNYGGHCGRADDYHYHTAPLFLDDVTPVILPIAFALDGFAVYGSLEPDGATMIALDANHGHYGDDGVYHYHGTSTAPYMIGNMVGKVTEDNTLQIIPQAHANPIRPAGTPLQGAVITDCQSNGPFGYTLTYTKSGQTYTLQYSWTQAGVYTFNFVNPGGTTTQIYNGFAQCDVPTATFDAEVVDSQLLVFPNPANDGISIQLSDAVLPNDILAISLYNLKGKKVYQTDHYTPKLDINHLAKGPYFVKIQLSNQLVTKKIIVL
jgi:hypothetical protein